MRVITVEDLIKLLSKYKGKDWKVVLTVETADHTISQGELSGVGEDFAYRTIFLMCQPEKEVA